MNIHEEFHERCATPSDIVEHLPFMRDLVVEQNATTVVELGVRSGNSTAAFLSGVELTGGCLWSVDVEPAPAALAGFDCWRFIQGNDLEVADQLPADIDVLFIDTSHHYEHTLAELRLYGPRTTWVLLHDTELEHPHLAPATDPRYPVRMAIEAWCDETGRTWINRPHCWGLGIIQPEGV